MTDRIDWDRIARYASGEADARERAEVEAQAAADSAYRDALDSVRRGWDASAEPTNWDVEGAWARLAPRLAEQEEATVIPMPASRRSWWRASTFVPMAAAAALILAVSFQVWPGGADPTASVLAAGTELSTSVGEQRRFNLPDGSTVMLGAASRLRLADAFGSGSREVHLEGQAYITVVHDESRPFVVNAGGTRTVDLGTAFEVRAYPNEGVRVVVTEGSVEVQRDSAAQPEAVLQAGDLARLVAGADAVIQRQVDVTRLLGWTRGELTFDDATLVEVSRELERWYDIDARIDTTAIESLRFSLQGARVGESLDNVLELIELALKPYGVRAQRDGRSVTFTVGAPAASPNRRAAAGVEVGA